MRKYEIMFIVKPDLEEKAVKDTVKKLEKTLTDNKAVITLSKELGQKVLIVKFRLKLKKVGKTTRPFRYDLNQIPYDYTVEMGNRFKGLDLIDKSA